MYFLKQPILKQACTSFRFYDKKAPARQNGRAMRKGFVGGRIVLS